MDNKIYMFNLLFEEARNIKQMIVEIFYNDIALDKFYLLFETYKLMLLEIIDDFNLLKNNYPKDNELFSKCELEIKNINILINECNKHISLVKNN